MGLSTRVVLELLDGLEEEHPKLYVDNYYTSPILFLKLYKKGINVCGTVRTNRKHEAAYWMWKKGQITVKCGSVDQPPVAKLSLTPLLQGCHRLPLLQGCLLLLPQGCHGEDKLKTQRMGASPERGTVAYNWSRFGLLYITHAME